MNLRQLRKQDKRAAALILAAHPNIKPSDFGDGWDGRWSYWSCCPMEGEWDECPARTMWCTLRFNEHPNTAAWMGFNEETGESIPEAQRPRALRPHEVRQWEALRAPAGFRWRGRRVVPVDKHGAMVRTKKGPAS